MKLEKLIEKAKNSPNNLRYSELEKICDKYFVKTDQRGTSHQVYKTPWAGDPRVNIQEGKNGMAKVYQINQILKAIKKIQEEDY